MTFRYSQRRTTVNRSLNTTSNIPQEMTGSNNKYLHTHIHTQISYTSGYKKIDKRFEDKRNSNYHNEQITMFLMYDKNNHDSRIQKTFSTVFTKSADALLPLFSAFSNLIKYVFSCFSNSPWSSSHARNSLQKSASSAKV